MNIDLTRDKSFTKNTPKLFFSLLDGTVMRIPWESQICYKQLTNDYTEFNGRFDDSISREMNIGLFRTWNDKWFALGGRKEWRDMEYLLPIFIVEELGGLRGDAVKYCLKCGKKYLTANPISLCPTCAMNKNNVSLHYKRREQTFAEFYFR